MTTYTLFSQGAVGSSLTTDASAYTMGVQFSVAQAGMTLPAIWFYSAATATVLPQTIALYAVSGTSLVHSESASWSGSAGTGWVRAAFASPPALTASTAYKACVLQDTGTAWYTATASYWSSGAGSGGITNGPLSAPNDASAAQGQDTFTASAVLAYPASSFNATNYWVDPEVTTGAVAHTATASLAVTPSLSASRILAHVRAASLTVTPDLSANAPGAFALPGPAIPGLAVPGVVNPGLPRGPAVTSAPPVVFTLGVPYFRWAAGSPYLS